MPSVNGEGQRLLTPDEIAMESLTLLKNSLVVAPLVHRNLEREFGNVGDSINVRLPPRVKSAEGRRLQIQARADQTVPFTINRHRHVGLNDTVRDRTLSMNEYSDRYLRSGVTQLANHLDRSILLEMRKAFFHASGTPGTAVSRESFFNAEAHMTMVGVPWDGMNSGVAHPLDRAAITKEVSGLNNDGLVRTALQRGYMGPISNFEMYGSANIPLHTVGDHGGTPLVNGASQTGSTLVTDGWDTSTTDLLLEGDVFTIAGVYEVNPQSYASTGRLQRFVVTSDVDSDGSGNASISISPSINDGTLTTVDENGDTVSLKAYQNVSAAPANNAAITVIGTANATYRQDFLFHRDAVSLAMIELEKPEGLDIASTVRDPDSGISICLTGGFDIQNYQNVRRLDVVWGTHSLYPELGHKLYSAAAS